MGSGSKGKKGKAYAALQSLMLQPGDHSDFWDELFNHEASDPKHRIASALRGLPKYEDRVAAIIYASILESSLEYAISTRFVLPPDKTGKMFSYPEDGPLSSFAAKIAMGEALGIFGDQMRKDIKWIKDIRNAFAHTRVGISFKTPAVIAACDELIFPKIGRPFMYPSGGQPMLETARQKYSITVATFCTYLLSKKRAKRLQFKRSAVYRHLYPESQSAIKT